MDRNEMSDAELNAQVEGYRAGTAARMDLQDLADRIGTHRSELADALTDLDPWTLDVLISWAGRNGFHPATAPDAIVEAVLEFA